MGTSGTTVCQGQVLQGASPCLPVFLKETAEREPLQEAPPQRRQTKPQANRLVKTQNRTLASSKSLLPAGEENSNIKALSHPVPRPSNLCFRRTKTTERQRERI